MRNCLMCSHSFSPNLPQQKYCGPRCYVAANNARTRQDPAVKRCRTCTQSKTVDQFVVGHHNCNDCEALYADGLKRCSECRLVKPFADIFRRPRRSIPYGSKCKECLGRKAKTKNADPEQRARNQELKWRQRFGITRDEYSAMLQRQGGKCGICAEVSGETLHVDHDHGSGRIRQLLCRQCNALLGNAKDDPEILLRAAEYLKEHSYEDVDLVG